MHITNVSNIQSMADGSQEHNPKELRRLELAQMEELHQGHESMHAETFLIFVVTIVVAQVSLVEWKRRHPKSYRLVTLAGMWLIPVGTCVRNGWWRFVVFWLVFTCTSAFVVMKAVERPVHQATPRLVYKWFYFIYKLSYVLGITGYVIGYVTLVSTVFGIVEKFGFKPGTMADTAALFLFYGLYYGVLGQDLAEISSDKMASCIGYYFKEGLPTRSLDANVCAVCGNKIRISKGEKNVLERTFELSCRHVFHEFCIRGWCIVGKKQMCPYCNEKVDLEKLFPNPWEKPHILYGSLLDCIRILVAWQPVILGLVQMVRYSFGLE